MTVFERIKKLSNKKGKSLQTVAEENGFSPNLFYRWKKSDPKGKDLAKVADYFKTTTDYLLGRTDNPSIPNQKNAPTTFEGLGLPYKGIIPEDVNDMYHAIAKQYAEKHNLPKRDV